MAISTLALGIGINTLVFTLYNSVALKPLAVRAPEEISRLQWRADGSASDLFSWTEYQRTITQSRSFASVVATSTPQTVLCQIPELSGAPEIVQIRLVSPNYFVALGVSPVIGRAFGESDRTGVVISHDFWIRKLYSDPAVYLRTVNVQGAVLPVLGVAPKTFAGTGAPAQTPDLWIPAPMQTSVLPGRDWMRDNTAREWQILARRKAGISAAQSDAELPAIASAWQSDNGKPVHLSALRATFFQTDSGEFADFASICLVLLIAVLLVLMMGCVNLVNLIAARNAGREHEIGVRLALGASRFRLLRQLCTESLVLGALGGVAGLVISVWTCAWLTTRATSFIQEISGGALRIAIDLEPDWRVLLWTLLVSLATGLAVGLLPALRTLANDLSSTLKQGTAGAGMQGVKARRMRNVLMGAQVASCLVLLTAAGLLFRGVTRSGGANPGFETSHLSIVGMNTKTIAGTAAARLRVVKKAVERLEAAPETAALAWTDRAPYLGHGSADFMNEAGTEVNCLFAGVSDRYFEALGVPLLSGRTFTRQEVETDAPLAIVSEAAAARYWPGKNPLGRKIVADKDWARRLSGHLEYTVIGVSKTLRSTFLSKEDSGFIYMPRAVQDSSAVLLVRTRTTPAHAFKAFTAILASVDANLPSRTYMIGMEQGPMRLQSLMSQAPAVAASVLGALALLLACLGIFGVVSRLVAMRTREIGLRLVLGATKQDVVRLIAAQTFRPVAWGAAVGLAGALAISSLLNSLVAMPTAPDLTYGAGAFDPVTFVSVFLVLALTVALAGAGPVRHATLVEPAIALRDE